MPDRAGRKRPGGCPAVSVSPGQVQDGGTDRIVRAVLSAVERHDQVALKALLHPYLHWHEPRIEIRGRVKVLARPAAAPAPAPPAGYELRDGRIYRWNAPG